MKRFKEIYKYNCDEIKTLAGCYAVIACLVAFMAWQHDAKGCFMEFLVVLSAIASAFIAIPTIMGTMVLVSDILEELFEKENY